MLEYDRIKILERLDTKKTNASKECDVCHYWYFKIIGFKYEPYLYNGRHGLMQKAMNFNDVAIVSIKRSDYKIHFWNMNKDVAINMMKNYNLNEKSEPLYIFFIKIKMRETTYYQRNREIILNRTKDEHNEL